MKKNNGNFTPAVFLRREFRYRVDPVKILQDFPYLTDPQFLNDFVVKTGTGRGMADSLCQSFNNAYNQGSETL